MIVPVKKVKIFTLEEHKVDLLTQLQKDELIMISNNQEQVSVDTKFEDDTILKASSVIKRLTDFQKKKDFFEYQTVDYNDFITDDIKRFDLLNSIEEDFTKYEELKQSNIEINKENEILKPFQDFPYVLNDLTKSLYVSFHVGYILEKNQEVLVNYFNEKSIEHEFYEISKYGIPLIFVLDKDEVDLQLNQINSIGFIKANLPQLKIKVAREIENNLNQYAENNKDISELEDSFVNSKEQEMELRVLVDQMIAKKARMNVLVTKTDSTIYIEGWVREDQLDLLKQSIESVTTTFDIDISEPLDDDIVPTATKNNKFVKQFETITNMYSVPNHKEVDPNPAMSIWYWLIFGIMMGDIGYGLVMVVLFGLFIKLKKPKGSMSQLIHVLYYSGYTTILAGIAFGSVFGFDVNVIGLVGKIFGQSWQSFSVMNDPLTMLIFSIALGICHIITALVLKVMVSIKHKDIYSALSEGVSWISILTGLSLAVIGQTLLTSKVLSSIGLVLIGIGVLLIVFLSGHDKKGILPKTAAGLGGIYGATSYLSDLLSYSRILALSLSSAVIASTMNLLASLLHGNIFGIILSIAVYIVGHVFNFAMGLLSAYVHDSRLQYIEFYNKFYEGGGIEFTPLSFENKHIQEITN